MIIIYPPRIDPKNKPTINTDNPTASYIKDIYRGRQYRQRREKTPSRIISIKTRVVSPNSRRDGPSGARNV